MSYRATVGMWMLMVCVVLLCLTITPKAHAVQSRPSIDFYNVQPPEEQMRAVPAVYLPPAAYMARAISERQTKDEDALWAWTMCIIIVMTSVGYLLFLLLHPWRFQAPHCPELREAATAGREAVNKCAMPRAKV